MNDRLLTKEETDKAYFDSKGGEVYIAPGLNRVKKAQDTKSVKAVIKIIQPHLDYIHEHSHPLYGGNYCQACLITQALKRGEFEQK